MQSAIPEAFGGYGDQPLGDHQRAGAARSSAGAICRSRCTSWRRGWSSTRSSSSAPTRRSRTCCRAFTGAQFVAGTAAVMEPRFNFDVRRADHDGGAQQRRLRAERHASATCRSPPRRSTSSSTRAARRGSTALLVPRDTPGFTVGEREKNMGLKALATYEVQLEDCTCRRGPAGRRFHAAVQPLARRAGGARRRRRARRFRVRARLRQGAQGLRRRHRAEAGDRVHARRDGDRDRRDAPAHLGGGVEDRPRRGRHARGLPRHATTPPTWCSR